MIPARRIALASVVAPMFVVIAWLVVAAVYLVSGENGVRLAEYMPIALGFGVSIYVPLVATSAITGFALQRLGRLSMLSLFVVGATFSFVLSAWVTSSALQEVNAAQMAGNFVIHLVVALLFFCGLFFAWWRLASNPSIKRTPDGAA